METLTAQLPTLLKLSCQASILIVLVLAAQWLFGPRLAPRWRYMLWLLVILRLVVPWTIPSPASPFNALKFDGAGRTSRTVMEASNVPASAQPALVKSPVAPILSDSLRATKSPNLEQSNAVTNFLCIVRDHLLFLIWAAGVLVFTGWAAVCHYRFRRQVAGQRPLVNESALNLLEDCKAQMNVRIPIALVETTAIDSPTLFGFVRPRLLLPAGLASNFTREELGHIFLHELAHIKRHDIFTGWIMLGLQIVHWFNPFVWFAFYRMRVDRELACDALALSCGQSDENESYGLTIVKLLEGFGQSGWRPSLAGILENKQQIKERISMIAKFRKTERGLGLAIVLCAVMALVTFTRAETSGDSSGNGALDNWNVSPLQQKLDAARAGDQWAAFQLWDAYSHGTHGLLTNQDEAEKWLEKVVENVSIVRFEPIDDFSPKTPEDFLGRVNNYAHDFSGKTNIGAASFFRTTRQGDKLVASFLSSYPDKLKADLSTVPGVKVTSVEPITPQEFVTYQDSPQESLVDLDHPDASMGIWAVRFEPIGDFSPKTPEEYLARIHQYANCYSGQSGEIGYFRTKKEGDKLVGSFLAYDGDELKAALAVVPGIKVTSVEKLTQEQLTDYENSPQEWLEDKTNMRQEKRHQRIAADQAKYTQQQLYDAESLYQVANNNWGSPEAIKSLQAMVKKYPDMNRAGCAVLYLAQMSQGKERERYLNDCIKKYDDCFYGDGVQVGALARLFLAEDYKNAGEDKKAKALFDEIASKYPDAVDHDGKLLAVSSKTESPR